MCLLWFGGENYNTLMSSCNSDVLSTEYVNHAETGSIM